MRMFEPNVIGFVEPRVRGDPRWPRYQILSASRGDEERTCVRLNFAILQSV